MPSIHNGSAEAVCLSPKQLRVARAPISNFPRCAVQQPNACFAENAMLEAIHPYRTVPSHPFHCVPSHPSTKCASVPICAHAHALMPFLRRRRRKSQYHESHESHMFTMAYLMMFFTSPKEATARHERGRQSTKSCHPLGVVPSSCRIRDPGR